MGAGTADARGGPGSLSRYRRQSTLDASPHLTTQMWEQTRVQTLRREGRIGELVRVHRRRLEQPSPGPRGEVEAELRRELVEQPLHRDRLIVPYLHPSMTLPWHDHLAARIASLGTDR